MSGTLENGAHRNTSALGSLWWHLMSIVRGMVVTLCMILSQALAAAVVEPVIVMPIARAEHVSAARIRTAVSVLREGSAAGTDTARATAASARMATTAPYVSSAQAARRHARDTGEATGLTTWEQGHSRAG